MLTCLPASLCTWNFRVVGASASPAGVAFNFFSEQGDISLGAQAFTIRKHGPLSGHWTMEENGRIFADADKPSALFRSFEVRSGDGQMTVTAQSTLTRSFDLISGERTVGVVRPAHPLTRRAFIECAPEVPEPVQLFVFWLAVLTWRRAANNRAASG